VYWVIKVSASDKSMHQFIGLGNWANITFIFLHGTCEERINSTIITPPEMAMDLSNFSS
jgi:hypothetical protein